MHSLHIESIIREPDETFITCTNVHLAYNQDPLLSVCLLFACEKTKKTRTETHRYIYIHKNTASIQPTTTPSRTRDRAGAQCYRAALYPPPPEGPALCIVLLCCVHSGGPPPWPPLPRGFREGKETFISSRGMTDQTPNHARSEAALLALMGNRCSKGYVVHI